MAPVIPRRTVLRLIAALAPAAALVAVAGPAAAFREIPTDDATGLLDDACGVSAYHARLIDESLKTMGVSLTREQRAEVLAQITCPTCRCPLAAFDNPIAGLAF
ncbi:hypothetical protein [Azospirillum halopraeferens]|uniref:hypothetical protein n=1 Tax=Azospirillum halopraeferens TaxID=34010 RepID=UPI0004019EBD|nr:hypothetical protein [Azospirillum halopraeferens]